MTLGSHQRASGKSQVHLTPRWLVERLGPFSTDPCAARQRPWDCATDFNYTEADNGLSLTWYGRVWLNPPFDRYAVSQWVAKIADHGTGTALLHARTETDWFLPVWERATAILFMADRIKFCRPDGTPQKANSGAPPVLVAFGQKDADILYSAGISGFYTRQWVIRPGRTHNT